jgi:hypothetical protein
MYAFVHIEKTAGSCLVTILRREFGARHCDIRLPLMKRRDDFRDQKVCVEAADLRRVRRWYRKMRGIAGHNVKAHADLHVECPRIQFFTVLRDPAKRFLSHFLNRGEGNDQDAFDRWISAEWVHNWQTKMIAGEPNAEKAIELLKLRFGFLGLTERFDESLVLLRQWLDEPVFRGEYRRVNQLSDKCRPRDVDRKRRNMSYLETEETRARIRAANAEDQKVYDFVISNVYPRQVAAYRGDLAAEVQSLQQLNQRTDPLVEPLWGNIMRNYIYKPLIHCHAA